MIKRKLTRLLTLAFTVFMFCSAQFSVFAVDTTESGTPDNAEPAKTEFTLDLYAPDTYLEYYALTSPVDVASNEDYLVVAESRRLAVFDKNAKKWLGENDSTNGFLWTEENYDLKQVELISHYVFIRDAYIKLFMFDILSGEFTDLGINGTYFSINDNYLANGYQGGIDIYKYSIDENGVFSKTDVNVGASKLSGMAETAPVALSKSNSLFCFQVENDKTLVLEYILGTDEKFIRKNVLSINGTIGSSTDLANMYVTVNGDTLIMTVSTKPSVILVANVTAGTSSEMIITEKDGGFSLIKKPMGLCIFGSMVLVADSTDNAIKGYSLDSFTYGDFAIATEVEYPTRLYKNAIDIDIYENKQYVLEKNRLLIISERKIIKEIALSSLFPSFVPNKFAVGKDYAILIGLNDLAFVRLSDGTSQKAVVHDNSTANLAADYSDGYFYILQQTYTSSIIKYNSETLEKESVTLSVTENAKNMTTDIEGNIYIYTDNGTTQNLYTYADEKNTLTQTKTINLSEKAIKLQADFSGNVYLLTASGKLQIITSSSDKTYSLKLNANLPSNAAPNSFAVNFDCQTAYFTFEGKGFVASTDAVISSANRIAISSDLDITATTAKETDAIAFYTVKENAKIYNFDIFKLTTNEKYFSYTNYEIADTTAKYIKIGETEDFIILLGKTLCLVRKANAVSFTESLFSDAIFTYVYATTTVNLYYYPKLIYTPTAVGDPTLWADSPFFIKDSLRLTSGTKLKVLKEIDFNGTVFSYVEYTDGEKTINAYVPKNATSQTLADELVLQKYEYKTLLAKESGTAIYSEPNGTIQVIIKQPVKVKVYKTENGFSFIEYDGENGTKLYGYVESGLFLEKGTKTLRNTMIFLLLTCSLAATSTYFIVRFHKDEKEV